MSRPPSTASSDSSAVSEADSEIERPNDSPVVNWKDLLSSIHLCHLKCNHQMKAPTVDSRPSSSRGRPKKDGYRKVAHLHLRKSDQTASSNKSDS